MPFARHPNEEISHFDLSAGFVSGRIGSVTAFFSNQGLFVMRFDDLKLRTKILIPLVGMALLFTCVTGGGIIKMNELSRDYGHITTAVDPALLQMARAGRYATEISNDVFEELTYDPDDPRGKQALANFEAAKTSGDSAIDEAARVNPERAERYRAFKDQFDAIYRSAQAPMHIGSSIPGIVRGRALKPTDLDELGVAGRAMADLNDQVRAFTGQSYDYNHAVQLENARAVETLNRQSAITVAAMVGMAALSILGGLAMAIWAATAKVANPLIRLGGSMKQLAEGDLSAEIEGQDRADEVGAMAKAVQTFKDHALKTRVLEADAQAMRDAAEAERQAIDKERAERAAELARVVNDLAGGLRTLADGVLTNRFGFTISWATNISVVVESCTNFTSPVWVPVATNILVSGSAYFSDANWTNSPDRYYRLRSM